MGYGGWHLPSKTPCVVCGKPIKRTKSDSYACPKWLGYAPAHFRCAYPQEMAVTSGEES